MPRILVTGCAGFIGSHLTRRLVHDQFDVLGIDALTYAGHTETIRDLRAAENFRFETTDICDADSINRIISTFHPEVIFHLAAETHVDRSIQAPLEFVRANIAGTANLLEAFRQSLKHDASTPPPGALFVYVSTDEVYGSVSPNEPSREDSPLDPSSPYSASKASGELLARSWARTFGIPVTISRCSNNYGPWQLPEKLIPLTITRALSGRSIPVYGDGKHLRDWIFVEDHIEALSLILRERLIGATYNIGFGSPSENIEIVRMICRYLDRHRPLGQSRSYSDLVMYTSDRPAHDRCYALDCTKIHRIGWSASTSLTSGIETTVLWYLTNPHWSPRNAEWSSHGAEQ